MRNFIFLLAGCVALSACQKSESGQLVAPPTVNVICRSGLCATDASTHEFVVYLTEAGCTNPEFSAKYSVSGTASCGAGTCTGSAASWTDGSTPEVATINSGRYDICAYLFFSGSVVTGLKTGDLRGSAESVAIAGPLTQNLTTWTAVQ